MRIPGPVDWGLLVLRLVLGGLFIVHGSQRGGAATKRKQAARLNLVGPRRNCALVVQKLFGALGGTGIAAFAGNIARMGLPGSASIWAYLAAAAEFGGGLAVFFGVLTEFGALAIAFVMIVAIWKVTGRHGFSATHNGYEYNLLILAVCAALILAGPGWLALWDPFRFRRGARSGAGWAAAEG